MTSSNQNVMEIQSQLSWILLYHTKNLYFFSKWKALSTFHWYFFSFKRKRWNARKWFEFENL